MVTVRQQVTRRLLVAGVVLFLVMLPAVLMAYLAYKSLREIRLREDYYFGQVGQDLSKSIISTLESPLYIPGFQMVDAFRAGADLGDPGAIRSSLAAIETSSKQNDALFWYPGTDYPSSARALYFDPATFPTEIVSDVFSPIEERTLQVFREGESYEDLPRGFNPKSYQSMVAAIWGMRLKGETWLMTIILDESGKTLGFLSYRLEEREYLREARRLYNELRPAKNVAGMSDELARDLGVEIFFRLLPFNDEAIEASGKTPVPHNYVYSSKGYESTLWGIRVYVANRDRVRVNEQVVTSMLAMLAGTFALIILGILLLYYMVTRELQFAKLKSSFVSNVSHELKTPLSLIRLFSETLELDRVESDAEKMRFYSIIHNESVRLTNLINNILDFSRIEEGRKKYELGEENLSTLINETLDAYRFQMDTSGFEVDLSIGEGNFLARVDRDSFKQAVLNLLDNAVKYSGEKKRIEVELAEYGDFLKITVRDFGIGIWPADLPRVFDKFFRAGSEDVYKVKGSGLGLAVVKHIMDAHLGKTEVRSEPGKGSEFCLLFPRGARGAMQERTGQLFPDKPKGAGRSDDENTCGGRRAGYEVRP